MDEQDGGGARRRPGRPPSGSSLDAMVFCRVGEVERRAWGQAAALQGLDLSAWVRGACRRRARREAAAREGAL